jgi:hypothetical protein
MCTLRNLKHAPLLVFTPTTVVSSANLVIETEACMTTQSWVNREYRGLSMHPCGTPVFRISKVVFPTFTTWGQGIRMSRTQFYRAGFRPRAPIINYEFGGYYVAEG